MFGLMRAGLNYIRKNPIPVIAAFIAASAAVLHMRTNGSNEVGVMTSSDDPLVIFPENNPLGILLNIDQLTRTYVKPLNRPPQLIFHANRILDLKNWQNNKEKISKLRERGLDLNADMRDFLKEKLTNFFKGNPDLIPFYNSGKFNSILEDIHTWCDILSAAVSALEAAGGNCLEIAALNSIFASCMLSDVKVEIIYVENDKDNHVFVVINRRPGSPLEKPSKWGRKAVILDSWEANANQVYTSKNLPLMLTNIAWKKWQIKKCYLKENLAKLNAPIHLKNKLADFLGKLVEFVLPIIKKDFPKAYAILDKELHGDLRCLMQR